MKWVVLGGIILFTIIGSIVYFKISQEKHPPQGLDLFAKCLAQKKITMYGADWCPHCQNEKKNFGSSFQYVPYVECPKNTKLCLAKKINGYPTWLFPDGKRLEGEQGLEKIAEESKCALPKEDSDKK